MAQDFNSMFGTVNPQDAEAAYLARQQVSPNTMAQLPLLNQVVAMGGNAGAGLGNTVGRMLGGQTSVEADQALMKNIFSKAAAQSQDPMERLKLAAAEFDKFDPVKAQALRLEATKLEEAKAKSDERSNVGINKERMADLVQKQNPAMPRGEALAMASNPALMAKLLDPEAARKNERNTAIGQALSGKVPGLTPEMGAAISAENPALLAKLFSPELKTKIVTTAGHVQLIDNAGNVLKDFGPPQQRGTNVTVDATQGGGALKPSDINPTATTIRAELAPFKSMIEGTSNALELMALGDNPKADVQVDRFLATLAGDKQLSLAEVKATANAASLPQGVVDGISKIFTGTPAKLSRDEKKQILNLMNGLATKKYNENRDRLSTLYSTTKLSKDQVKALVGDPMVPFSKGAPKAGTKDGGYIFKGGDPSDRNNWEKL